MFEQSLTHLVLSRVGAALLRYRESFFYSLITRLVNFLKRLLEQSLTYNYIMGASSFEKKYKTSCIYNAVFCVESFFIRISKKIYDFISRLSQGGIVRAIAQRLKSYSFLKLDYVLGAFFVVMMIFPAGAWNNAYAVVGAVGFAFWYYISSLTNRSLGTDVRKLNVSLVAFVVSIVGAVFISPDRADSMRIALFFIASVVFAVIIWGSSFDAQRLKAFVTMMVAGLFIMCLYAIYQSVVGVPVDVLLTDVNTNAGMPGRVYSTFDNPNNFAEVIVLIIPFIYALIICSGKKISKALLLVVFGVCGAALLVSYSRSCYVAFAIATILFALLYDWRLLLPMAVVVLVAIPFLPVSVTNRILTIGSTDDTSNSYRLYLWDGVIKLVRHYGAAGIGIGPAAFAKAYPPFASIWAASAPHSHMLYLELLVELGVVGAVGFLAFFLGAIKKGLATFNKATKEIRCFIIAAISALGGISFTSCAEYIWFYPRVMFIYWAVIGILLGCVRCYTKTKEK